MHIYFLNIFLITHEDIIIFRIKWIPVDYCTNKLIYLHIFSNAGTLMVKGRNINMMKNEFNLPLLLS